MKVAHSAVFPLVRSAHSSNLDVLRAFAVATVFLGHFIQTFAFRGPAIGHFARFGVIVFFVHTALVLCQSIERLNAESEHVALRFYVRRIFRIYPLAILATLVVFWLRIPPMPAASYTPVTRGTLLANLALIQNLTSSRYSILAPLWSLPFEIQMYAVLPLCYALVIKRKFSAFWLCGMTAAAFFIPLPPLQKVIQYFPCFLAGVWAYNSSKRAAIRAGYWRFFIVLACLTYTGATTAIRYLIPEHSQFYLLAGADWLCALSIGFAIPHFQDLPRGATRLAQIIAKYSYGIYLSHLIVMWIVLVPLAHQPIALRIFVFLAANVAFPVFAYHALEEPMVRVGKRLSGVGPQSAFQAAA